MQIIKKMWVIMDKDRGVIGAGVPRNRELKLVNDNTGTSRLLTYPTKKRAESGFKTSGFFSWGEAGEYMDKKYGQEWDWGEDNRVKYLEAVEAEFIINIEDKE